MAREKRKTMNKQNLLEDRLSNDLRVWRNEILPDWENSLVVDYLILILMHFDWSIANSF